MIADLALQSLLLALGYIDLKVLDDEVVVGIKRYYATYGLTVDIDEDGYERRYCYEFYDEAKAALDQYVDYDTHPTGQWIKCKGSYRGDPIDLMNPEWTGHRGS